MKTKALKILAWLTGVVLSLAVLGVIAISLSLSGLGSDQGRAWVARQIEQRADFEDYQITIGDIQVLNNRHIVLDGLSVRDKDGELLRLKDINLGFVAKAFLTGDIRINSLEIGEVALLRLPKGRGDQVQGGMQIPDIPRLRVDHFGVGTIILPASITGKVQTLALDGKLILSPALTGSAVEIHLRDKTSNQKLVDLVLSHGSARDVSLSAHIQDQGGGLIASLIGLPSIVLDLDGSSTENVWQGNLSFDAGEAIHAKNKVTLDLGSAEMLLTIEGASRYEEFTAEGKTTLRLNQKTGEPTLDFDGTLRTPDVTLNDLQAQIGVDPDKNIFKVLQSTAITLTLTGKTSTVSDTKTASPIDALAQASFGATATLIKDKIHIENTRIKTDLFETTAQGDVVPSKKTLALNIKTTIPDLKVLEPNISGAAQVSMNLSGTYQPLAIEAPLDIKTTDFFVPWPQVSALLGQTPSMSAKLSYADNLLVITDGGLRGQNLEKIDFSGTVKDAQPTLILSTHYQEYDLKTKLTVKDKAVSFSDFTAHGPAGDLNGSGAYQLGDQTLQAVMALQANAESSISLTLSGPIEKISGKGVVKGMGAFPYQFDYAGFFQESGVTLSKFAGTYGSNKIVFKKPATIMFTDKGISVKDITLGVNDGTMTAVGAFGAEDFTADIVAENIPANLDIFPFLFDGRVAGKMSLSGPYKNPLGNANFTLKHISIPALKDMQDRYVDGSITATYKDSVLQAKADLQGPADLRFKANGHLPLTISPLGIPPDKPVQVALNSAVDLRALTILLGLDEQRITGKVALEATLSGTRNNPVIKGTGSLRNATYENLLTGTVFKDIAADISAAENLLSLTNLVGRDENGGRFTGSGQVQLKDFRDPGYDFSLNADRLQLVNLDSMGVMASGRLNTLGNKDRVDVKGDISINHAEYYIGEIITTGSLDGFEIIETNAGKAPALPEKKPLSGPEINLAVNIDANNNVFIRSPDLETEWGGKLAVLGTTTNPLLKGNMTLVRGQFDLLDTVVDLTKGTISFVNPDPANPVLDVTGTIKGREMDAILKIGGEAQKPEISLTSEPPLPEDEILAKTLFGKSLNQLSPMQALRIAQLMASLSGHKQAGFNPLDKIRRAIGIDTLSVGMDDEKGATLSVGKYVNDRVYVGVDQGAAPGSSAVRTEIDVRKNIDIETLTNNNGESSVGVNWKRDY